jgi:tRNA dimethylallyltransferase
LSFNFGAGRDPLSGYRVLKIGLDPPRADLYERIDQRVLKMFESGLVEETRAILARGYPPTAKPFESLGYKQVLEHLQGRMSREEAIASTQMQTRRYAKRQGTWFRREHGVCWIQGFGNQESTQSLALEEVVKFLRLGAGIPGFS